MARQPPLRMILASASSRRLDLLRGLDLEPEVIVAGIEERMEADESPSAMVQRLATDKGRAVAGALPEGDAPALILAADTAVIIDGLALGKPRDAEDAEAMLRRLSGRTHEVSTGVFLHRTDSGLHVRGVDTTRVRFLELEAKTIRDYVAGGEPMDKAGSYGIQGDGARLVAGIEGSWTNVVGLPIERLAGWCEQIGLALDALRPRH